ncbi:uncharacterized protein LOC122024673 isoform X2 [Zingiber officinale]|uniref:uncharacterized protein LOC122024673 isoform X2 n=1 Tax=Zingiber officinale TaxID=94328 RepID=UPI001C4B8668|nr:uncharacterized protein LOC122024673 isoform X2 [Zingiber officinale]
MDPFDNRFEKDLVAARKVQKAGREKLRREKLNEQFLELGNALDPEQHKNDKVTILRDTIQMLKDLTAKINTLKAEYNSLSEESHELTQEKNELREEKANLKSAVDHLSVQCQQRLAVVHPWAICDSSLILHPPYPVPIPSAPILIHSLSDHQLKAKIHVKKQPNGRHQAISILGTSHVMMIIRTLEKEIVPFLMLQQSWSSRVLVLQFLFGQNQHITWMWCLLERGRGHNSKISLAVAAQVGVPLAVWQLTTPVLWEMAPSLRISDFLTVRNNREEGTKCRPSIACKKQIFR